MAVSLLRVLVASLVCAPQLVAGQGFDGAMALLQGAVRINEEVGTNAAASVDDEADEEDTIIEEVGSDDEVDSDDEVVVDGPPTSKRYLVDNSVLGHKGPGLLWRNGKDLSDTVAANRYVTWGTTVEGFDAGDGWVKVDQLYLPTHIHGAAVLKNEQPVERKKLRISYKATSVRVQDGSWIPCQIVGLGSKPNTFNLEVNPPVFASYNMSDVPASMLKKVQRVRQFITVPTVKPAVQPKGKQDKSAQVELNLEGFMQAKVEDLNGKVWEMQVLKKSPLRTTMKIACEHMKNTWEQCQRKVRFLHKGVPVNASAHPYEIGMRNGGMLHMERV